MYHRQVALKALIFQIRQNTRSLDESRRMAMAQTYQERANSAVNITMQHAMSAELTEITLKLLQSDYPHNPACLDELSPDQKVIYTNYLLAQKIRVDNQFYQYQQGYIDDEYFENNFREQVLVFGPGWNLLTPTARPSFRREIDKVLASASS